MIIFVLSGLPWSVNRDWNVISQSFGRCILFKVTSDNYKHNDEAAKVIKEKMAEITGFHEVR